MEKQEEGQQQPLTWIDQQANSPYPIWALSALSFASIPLAAKRLPGIPSILQSFAFGGIFAGAGYVTHVGDAENGAGIATAWCLSWSFLNAKRAITSMKPVPLVLLSTVVLDTVIYGKKTLQVNGYI
ncbi:altered inheritance of mitochondria protein 19 [Phascolomyces articulosus]|uniref:Altered inheritance of mitochondria protein 19 n=1 Tax=Phascolomyces articulosus TaxID=60185 RepID=A0AAD5K913_9FUNG|nr:altered inheritance of mitochondria protein 19 [Phascolomyces articulosus]